MICSSLEHDYKIRYFVLWNTIPLRSGRAADTYLWALASRDSFKHLRMSALVPGFVEVVLSSFFAH